MFIRQVLKTRKTTDPNGEGKVADKVAVNRTEVPIASGGDGSVRPMLRIGCVRSLVLAVRTLRGNPSSRQPVRAGRRHEPLGHPVVDVMEPVVERASIELDGCPQ